MLHGNSPCHVWLNNRAVENSKVVADAAEQDIGITVIVG